MVNADAGNHCNVRLDDVAEIESVDIPEEVDEDDEVVAETETFETAEVEAPVEETAVAEEPAAEVPAAEETAAATTEESTEATAS